MNRIQKSPFFAGVRGGSQRIPAKLSFLLAVSIAGTSISSGASAQEAKKEWARCLATDNNKMEIYYYSAVFKLPPNQTEAPASFGAAFFNWIKASVDSSVNMVTCDTGRTAESYEHFNRLLSEDYGHIAQVKTDFRDPANPPAPPAMPGMSRIAPAPTGLIIKDNGEAVRAKAWDDSVMQIKREDAARKVRAAIATAESKVEYERIMKAAAERMRKLGGKQ